jgi:peptide deformylase
MTNKVVEDIQILKNVCEPCGLEESRDIIEKLFLTLSASESGIGLAANQIGIAKRVCVVNVRTPVPLVNPKIIGSFGKIAFDEGCLSFPGQTVRTLRSTKILVKADNFQDAREFGSKDLNDFENLLECICVQHEIDHLDGLTMFDREFRGNFKSMEKMKERE